MKGGTDIDSFDISYGYYNQAVTYLYLHDSLKADSMYRAALKLYPLGSESCVQYADRDIIEGLHSLKITDSQGRDMRRYFALTDQEIDDRVRTVKAK